MDRVFSTSILLLALLCAMCPSADAQDTYRLDESDAWTALEQAPPGSPAGRLAQAHRMLAKGDAKRAEEQLNDWIEQNPRDPLLVEAYLLRGDALLAQREHYKALYDYEFVIRGYPGSEAFVTALERELDIARLFAAGMKRKLWGMRVADAKAEAEELFIRVQERMPGSRLAEEAGMDLADYYFQRRNMSLAAEAYSLFIENYPRSAQISKARRRLIYAHLAAFKGPQHDVTGLLEAQAKLRELEAIEPATAQQIGSEALRARIDESSAQKLFKTASWYWQTGDAISAEFTIRRLVRQHPRSMATAQALRLIPQILPKLPQAVLDRAPDYAALRALILQDQGPVAAPADEVAPDAPELLIPAESAPSPQANPVP